VSSPLCGATLEHDKLVPNFALRDSINLWKSSHPDLLRETAQLHTLAVPSIICNARSVPLNHQPPDHQPLQLKRSLSSVDDTRVGKRVPSDSVGGGVSADHAAVADTLCKRWQAQRISRATIISAVVECGGHGGKAHQQLVHRTIAQAQGDEFGSSGDGVSNSHTGRPPSRLHTAYKRFSSSLFSMVQQPTAWSGAVDELSSSWAPKGVLRPKIAAVVEATQGDVPAADAMLHEWYCSLVPPAVTVDRSPATVGSSDAAAVDNGSAVEPRPLWTGGTANMRVPDNWQKEWDEVVLKLGHSLPGEMQAWVTKPDIVKAVATMKGDLRKSRALLSVRGAFVQPSSARKLQTVAKKVLSSAALSRGMHGAAGSGGRSLHGSPRTHLRRRMGSITDWNVGGVRGASGTEEHTGEGGEGARAADNSMIAGVLIAIFVVLLAVYLGVFLN
jgi:hypothetical protein